GTADGTPAAGVTGASGAAAPAAGPDCRTAPPGFAAWLARSSAELVEGAVAVAVPAVCETAPTDWTFSSAELSAATAGLSNLALQCGQTPRLPAKNDLTFSLCPLGQTTRIPMMSSIEGALGKRPRKDRPPRSSPLYPPPAATEKLAERSGGPLCGGNARL